MTHTEHESNPWTIEIGDHAQRADSPGYGRSRKLMIALVKQVQPWVFGDPPYQDHHGGGIWLKDAQGWFMILGQLGGEWSSQFCADPAKVDRWRQSVKRLVDQFPLTVSGYEELGYPDGRRLLDTPITDAATVGDWFDGIFNASVPLPAGFHTGVLKAGKQQGGMHHYPKPIVDIQFFKFDSFTLWVTDPVSKKPVAVAPVDHPGSGDARVQVLYATPGSQLHQAHLAAHEKGEALILPPDHPLAQQAFAGQGV